MGLVTGMARTARGGALEKPDIRVLRHAAFPIFATRYKDETRTQVWSEPGRQGTAFFLTTDGVFLTARHVVDAYDASAYSILAFNYEDRARRLCDVKHLEPHPSLDVAIGVAEPPNPDGYPHTFALATGGLRIGAAVVGFGYAKTKIEQLPGSDNEPAIGFDFYPKVYEGKVEDYSKEGIGRISGASYLHSAVTLGGISGGPLMRKRTMAVHGVLCSGSDEDAESPFGIAHDVRAFLDEWRIPFFGGSTIREYAAANPRRLALR